MPREQINTPSRRAPRAGAALDEGQHWENTPTLFIGWHRGSDHGLPSEEGCVQFHVTVDADEVLRAADDIRRGRANPEAPGHADWTFSTTTLSRVETQKAIRFVRRARDAVFGSDE